MKKINKRARLALYLLLSIELILVSGYVSWLRPHTNTVNTGSSQTASPVANPVEPGM